MHIPTVSTIAALALCAPLICQADEVYFDDVNTVSTRQAWRDHGASFGLFGGFSRLDSVDLRSRNGGLSRGDSESGWFVGLEFGYTLHNSTIFQPGIELEGIYLDTDISRDNGDSLTYRSNTRSILGMANFTLALDFQGHHDETGEFLPNFRPYVGAGAGIAGVWQSNIESVRNGREKDREDRSEFTTAYNWFVGFDYHFSPEFSLYGEYRRLMIDDFGGEDVSNAELDLWTIGFRFQY